MLDSTTALDAAEARLQGQISLSMSFVYFKHGFAAMVGGGVQQAQTDVLLTVASTEFRGSFCRVQINCAQQRTKLHCLYSGAKLPRT